METLWLSEDAMQMLQKLQTMSPEDALPTWWTNKLAVASNSMNKMRDYLLVPSVSEEVELNEAEVSVFGFISTGARKKFLDDLKSMRLQFKSKVMNLPQPAPPSGVLKFDANQSTIEAIIKFAKRMNEFVSYVYDFYGKNGIYDMGATVSQIQTATIHYIGSDDSLPFYGDSLDRERVRDILTSKFNLKEVI